MQNNINILTILSSPNLKGGTPVKVLQIVKGSKYNHFIYFYSNGCCPENYDHDYQLFNEHAVCYSGFGRNIVRQIIDLLCIVRKQKIDIVQSYFFRGLFFVYAINVFCKRVKILYSFENGIPFDKRIKIQFANNWLKHIDQFVYISDFVQKSQTRFFPILSSKKGKVVFNGAEERTDNHSFDTIRNKYKLVLLCVGALTDLKNQILILKAMDIIVNKYKVMDILLNIVGYGINYELYKKYISENRLDQNVLLNGFSDDVGSALHNSDLYLHPAKAEGFGIAVVEAMLVGVPPILADAGGLPELIEDGISGYLLPDNDPKPWADRIMELYRNPQQINIIATNARKKAIEHFSVSRFVKSIDSLYQSLIP